MHERRAPAPSRRARTVLAFDFGRRRIGVAVGQDASDTAGALPALRGDCPGPDWRAVAALVETWKPDLLIVGRPTSLAGEATWMTELAEGFAHELARRHGLPVERADERLTSEEARRQLAEQRRQGLRRRRVQRADVDSMAAQLILRAWLEDHAATRRRTPSG